MKPELDPRFAPPQRPRKPRRPSLLTPVKWLAREVLVWVNVICALLFCALFSGLALSIAALASYQIAAVALGAASLFALIAGFILWGRNRLRGAATLGAIHLVIFGVAFHFQNPRQITREFLTLEGRRSPSSLQRVLKIAAPLSVRYVHKVYEDVNRIVRFSQAMRQHAREMCPTFAPDDRMGCYSAWVKRFNSAEPLTLAGQLVLIAVSVSVAADMAGLKKGLPPAEQKKWEAGIAAQLVEAVTLNTEILRRSIVHPWTMDGKAEPQFTLSSLTKLVGTGNYFAVDAYVVGAVDQMVYLTLLSQIAGVNQKSSLGHIFAEVDKLEPHMNPTYKRRYQDQKQWFGEFQTWAKATLPTQTDGWLKGS